MPVRFRARELFQPAVNTAEDFAVALRDGVAGFACNLWSSFPDFVTQGTDPTKGFARAAMNSMCGGVQPPVPPPTSAFIGGQCPGVLYIIEGIYGNGNQVYGTEGETRTFRNSLRGPIEGIEETDAPYIINDGGDLDRINDEILTVGVRTTDTFITNPNISIVYALRGTTVITSVTRQDGMPDTCGDPPEKYHSPEPTSNDLNTTINVQVNDGLDLSLEIQYIKLSNEYNFPMNFKVNGNNVTIDIDGITFHAPDGFGSPGGGNNVPPPGSDSGDDGAGGDITKIFEDNEYIVAPDNPPPRTVEQIIEYVLCTDGVLETISETVKIGVGNLPFLAILIEMVKNILTDLCETPEAILGLPEYYGLQPGANRPAIVYLWKEYINDTWQPSTYSSTVHHPSGTAIVEIENLTSIQKTIGTYKTFARLTDGSVIQATGDTPVNSQANFTFLITQVSPSFLPPDLIAATITSVDSRLSVKTLNLRQIEYYPNGKVGNASPSIRRVVEP